MSLHMLFGNNSDLIPIGNNIWKSSDGENYTMTVEHTTKPTIEFHDI